jgi:hypothetical protein
MKRLLGLAVAVLMAASLLAGIAFASPPLLNPYSVTGLPDMIVKDSVDPTTAETMDVNILRAGAPYTGPVEYYVLRPGLPLGLIVSAIETTNYAGRLIVDFPTASNEGLYYFVVKVDDMVVINSPFTYGYRIQIEQNGTVNYGAEDVWLTGKVLDKDGRGVSSTRVKIPTLADTEAVSTTSSGLFALHFATVDFPTCDLQIRSSSLPYFYYGVGKVTVNPVGFSEFKIVTSTPSHLPANLGLDIKAGAAGIVTDSAYTKYTFTGVKIEGPIADADGLSTYVQTSPGHGYYTKLIISGDKLPGTLKFLSEGTLTVAANYKDVCTGTRTVSIVPPAEVNLLGLEAEYNAGAVVFGPLTVLDANGDEFDRLAFKFSGPMLSDDVTGGCVGGSTVDVSFDVPTAGILTLEAKAYRLIGSAHTLVGIVTKTTLIKGFDVTISPREIQMNTPVDIEVLLKDEAGVSINNAKVVLENGAVLYEVSALAESINNGRYLLEDVNANEVAPFNLHISLYQGGAWVEKLELPAIVKAEGKHVYTVTPEVSTIVAGIPIELKFRAVDEGNYVAALTQATIGGQAAALSYDSATGLYTASGVTIYDISKPVTLVAGSAGLTEIGKAQLAVVPPVVTITPAKFTLNYKQPITIRITNPLTGAEISAARPALMLGDETIFTWYDKTGTSPANVATPAALYERQVLVTAADGPDEGTEATARLTMDLNFGGHTVATNINIPALPAAFTVDKPGVTVGANTILNFSLKDATGNPIPGINITPVGGETFGITDAYGIAAVTYRADNVGVLQVQAMQNGAAAPIATLKLNKAFDATPPVINVTLPPTTTSDSILVSGTVTDDTRLGSMLFVNNNMVPIVPGASSPFSYRLPLVMGENQVSIMAYDAAENGSQLVLTIVREAPAAKSVSVPLGVADPANGLDVPAFATGGRTFVPLRFCSQALGGSVDWDQATNTAIIIIEGKTIRVTIGSKVATLDGVPIPILVAPMTKSGRTFLGLRDIGNLLGADVGWDDATQTASLTLK